MSDNHNPSAISRRSFLQAAGAIGGGSLWLSGVTPSLGADVAGQGLPQRVLGRTNEKVSALSLGTWPCGKCDTIDDRGVAEIVNEAVDLGINLIDCARAYDNAESGIGKALSRRRDEVLLTTKVWADTAAEAQESFEESLRTLRTDHVDILYIHSVGSRDVEQVMAKDGALSYLLKQKEAGKTRFLGMSGHSLPKSFLPLVESGQIDVLLCAMNFVDRHIYGFEDKVLPAAKEQGLGIACMKVFGGMKGGFGVADGPDPGPQMGTSRLQQAINYSLGLPGVATLVIGVHTVEQLRQNVQMVKNYTPLTSDEQTALAKVGRRLAKDWGPRLGPVA
jgi:predicted aldo/keto reductase-like oxidoreductase